MKKLVCLLMSAVMMIVMTACGKSAEEKNIIGTWRYEGDTFTSIFTFNDDMTCSEKRISKMSNFEFEIEQSGTYEISKKTLLVYFNGENEYLTNIRFEDGNLIWESFLDDLVYTRVE